MGYIEMKYFEVINQNDEAIVIDDTFKNLELLHTFPLSACNFVSSAGQNYGRYTFPNGDYSNAIMYGISVDGLEGIKSFCLSVTQGSDIAFFDDTSVVKNEDVYSVRRDDISKLANVYVFGFKEQSKSLHGSGLEVYNENGHRIFTSEKSYLNVLACGSDTEYTIKTTNDTIVFTLGEDYVSKILENHKMGAKGVEYWQRPRFRVEKGFLKIDRLRSLMTYAVTDGDINEYNSVKRYLFQYNYGWLVGTI